MKIIKTVEREIAKDNVNSNQLITTNQWAIPKNIPRYSEEEIKNLSEQEKDAYRNLRKRASKSGRVVEVKKHESTYHISLWDFLPFFLGQIYSLIRLFVAYGDFKRTNNFNKKLLSDIKSNLIACLIYAFLVWPLIIIFAFGVFYPYMILGSSLASYAWKSLVENGINTGIKLYFDQAVAPLFSPANLPITLALWIGIGMFNLQTILFYLLFKFNKKRLYELQKNNVRQEIKRVVATKKQLNEAAINKS
ncbi:MAG: hypothetical protein HUJ42_02055 [Malacoplasma sp.]|nr:hypothetical protein [Malacoplasma sp.]